MAHANPPYLFDHTFVELVEELLELVRRQQDVAGGAHLLRREAWVSAQRGRDGRPPTSPAASSPLTNPHLSSLPGTPEAGQTQEAATSMMACLWELLICTF